MADTTDRAIRIAKIIELIVTELGGTSSHVAAAKVVLPAHAFDHIAMGVAQRADTAYRETKSLTLYGVTFERGDDDATIRDRATARAGFAQKSHA